MTTITAEVIAHSINEYGNEMITFRTRSPRWIHAEGRTHRQLRMGEDEFDGWEPRTPSPMEDPNLSRNASSSRAIPVARLIQDVLDDPAIPMFWGANQKGMQAGGECTELVSVPTFSGGCEDLTNVDAWLRARDFAIKMAEAYDEAGYHKQIVNRLLEPFSHINVVWSGTEWSNFYHLRRHNDAEPHIHLLADRMWEAKQRSIPILLKPGEWHLPFVSLEERYNLGLDLSIKLSVARCASVSYQTVDGHPMTAERAIALHDKLIASDPLHASPAEHQASADHVDYVTGSHPFTPVYKNPDLHGNLVGFCQYRKTLLNECM